MPRKAKPVAATKPNALADELPLDEAPEPAEGHIADRPDGFYWCSPDGKQEFGPFDTLEQARADMEGFSAEDSAPADALLEAESEIGVSDWIDPETGDPAEGYSRPHLADE